MKRLSLLALIGLMILVTTACTQSEEITAKENAKKLAEHSSTLSSICTILISNSEEINSEADLQARLASAMGQLQAWNESENYSLGDFPKIEEAYNVLESLVSDALDADNIPNTTLFDYSSVVRTCALYGVDSQDFESAASKFLPSGKIDLKSKLKYFQRHPQVVIELILKNKCAPTSDSAFYYELEDPNSYDPDQAGTHFWVIHRGIVIDGVRVTDTIMNDYYVGSLTEPFSYVIGPGGVGDEPWGCPEVSNRMTLEELALASR